MAWTVYQYALASIMLVTGSINTLSAKWADDSSSTGNPVYVNQGDIGKEWAFNHPFFQALCMFVGESACLIAFLIYKRVKRGTVDIGDQKFSPLIMLPPAMCDMCATSLMYMGLTLTYASTFQMLRGAVVIFTGLLTVAFLHRKLTWYQWLGILFVFIGLIIVGVANVSGSSDLPITNVITGDLLIVMAQIITATQMVIEEKFIRKYKVEPLQAVGWEGVFGFSVLLVLMIPFYYIRPCFIRLGVPDCRLEDAIDALFQIKNSTVILFATLGTITSIAFFNFAGVSVTKEMSATTRMVLDSLRTVVIWIVSILAFGEVFSVVQLVGFLILLAGTFVYNDALFRPLYIYYKTPKDELTEPLLSPEAENKDGYQNNYSSVIND